MKMRMRGTLLLLLLLEHILLFSLCEALRPGERIDQSLLKQQKQGGNQKTWKGQKVLQNPSGHGHGTGRPGYDPNGIGGGQGQLQRPQKPGQGNLQRPQKPGQGNLQRPPKPGQGNLQRPQKPGHGNQQCGYHKCINLPGLVCDRSHGKCNCPRGKVGDGRVQCADPARQCLCTMYGDPHITNFKGETFTLPLPCNHVLADLTTPPSRRSGRGCRVFITGRAKFSGNQNNSDISYENQVEISVSTTSTIFTTAINERGFNNPHLTHLGTGVKGSDEEASSEMDNTKRPDNGDIIQQTQQYKRVGRRRRGAYDLRVNTRTDEDGFNQVTIPLCQLNVKYRASDGAFSLQTPLRSVERRGLCGRCGRKSDRGSSSLTRQQSLRVVLASLYALSPVDHTDANIYPSCTALTKTIALCPQQRKPHATTFCGEMLTNPDVNRCLAGKSGKEHVQDVFATCFRFVCRRHTQCGKYVALFNNCLPKARAVELVKDKRFCY